MLLTTVMMLLLMLAGRGEGQNCSLADILAVEPDVVPLEKMDGHWFVNEASRDPGLSYLFSFTMDVVPTPTGFVLFLSRRGLFLTCAHAALNLSTTAIDSSVFTADDGKISVIFAAADSKARHALIYMCIGTVSAGSCSQPVIYLVGREQNSYTTSRWFRSLSTSPVSCFNYTSAVTMSHGEECPPPPMKQVGSRDCMVANFSVQENFNLDEFVSRPWRQILRLAPESEFSEEYVHTYSIQPDGSVLCDVSARNGDKFSTYKVNMTVTSTPGKLIYHDPNEGPIPYNVIHVDYDRYALVFGCVRVTAEGKCGEGRGWLWSREASLDRQYRLQANALIIDLCVNPVAWLVAEPSDSATGVSASLPVAAAAMFLGLVLISA